MKTLVTGSSGHLGEALVRTLRDLDREVVGLDRIGGPFTAHVGSITDRACVARCMPGVRVVLHAATLHKPHVATHSRADFVDTNVAGTLNLLEAAVTACVGCLVYASVERLRRDDDVRSPLARLVGTKGYHTEQFADGPYPVEST